MQPWRFGGQICIERLEPPRVDEWAFASIDRMRPLGEPLLGGQEMPFLIWDRRRELDDPETPSGAKATWAVDFDHDPPEGWQWLFATLTGQSWSVLETLARSRSLRSIRMGAAESFLGARLDSEVMWKRSAGQAVLTVSGNYLVSSDEWEERIVEAIWDVANLHTPLFGFLGEHTRAAWTGLEEALGQRPDDVVRLARRDFARGYSWVTILGIDFVDRLCGIDALAATGAFQVVRRLPLGAVWLQATAHYRDYDMPAASRVFRALRSVLLPGLPEPPGHNTMLRKLVIEDAAQS